MCNASNKHTFTIQTGFTKTKFSKGNTILTKASLILIPGYTNPHWGKPEYKPCWWPETIPFLSPGCGSKKCLCLTYQCHLHPLDREKRLSSSKMILHPYTGMQSWRIENDLCEIVSCGTGQDKAIIIVYVLQVSVVGSVWLARWSSHVTGNLETKEVQFHTKPHFHWFTLLCWFLFPKKPLKMVAIAKELPQPLYWEF